VKLVYLRSLGGDTAARLHDRLCDAFLLFLFSGQGASTAEDSVVIVDAQPSKDKRAMALYLSAKFASSKWAEELAILLFF